MKRFLFLLMVLNSSVFSQEIFQFDIKTFAKYIVSKQNFLKNNQWISFDMVDQEEKESDTIASVCFQSNDKSYYLNVTANAYYMVTTDTIWYVNKETEEFAVIDSAGAPDLFNMFYFQYLSYLEPFSYYTALDGFYEKELLFYKTEISEPYTRIYATNQKYNSGGKVREVGYKTTTLFLNDNNGLLDSVTITYQDGYVSKFSIINISFENKRTYIDSIFDVNNPNYKRFSRHNAGYPPYSWFATPHGPQDKLNSTILETPILNTDGDTIFFRETGGWRLIDIWTFGCRPCYKQLQIFQKELDSLGYRILQNKGVRLYCLNPISNRIDLMQNVAEQFNCKDIIYVSKGIMQQSDFGTAPEYILVSPSNEIVYKSRILGDYSELFKAKQEYEQKHQTK